MHRAVAEEDVRAPGMEARRVVQPAVAIGVRIEHVAMRLDQDRGRDTSRARSRGTGSEGREDETARDRAGPGPLRVSPGAFQEHDRLAGPVNDRRDSDRAVAEKQAIPRTVVIESERNVRGVTAGAVRVRARRDGRDRVAKPVGDGERTPRDLVGRAEKDTEAGLHRRRVRRGLAPAARS